MTNICFKNEHCLLKEGVMKTLDRIKKGKRARILGYNGGMQLSGRLSAMGFLPDTEVTMMSRYPFGPVLVFLRDTQVALGRGEAAKIRVEEIA